MIIQSSRKRIRFEQICMQRDRKNMYKMYAKGQEKRDTNNENPVAEEKDDVNLMKTRKI